MDLGEDEKKMSIANLGPVNIVHPVLALNISQTYETWMGSQDLYECARGVWKLSTAHASTVRFILAVYQGQIIEVYEATQWDTAGTTPYTWRKFTAAGLKGRYEFVGVPAPAAIRRMYFGRQLLMPFGQNPVRYI